MTATEVRQLMDLMRMTDDVYIPPLPPVVTPGAPIPPFAPPSPFYYNRRKFAAPPRPIPPMAPPGPVQITVRGRYFLDRKEKVIARCKTEAEAERIASEKRALKVHYWDGSWPIYYDVGVYFDWA